MNKKLFLGLLFINIVISTYTHEVTKTRLNHACKAGFYVQLGSVFSLITWLTASNLILKNNDKTVNSAAVNGFFMVGAGIAAIRFYTQAYVHAAKSIGFSRGEKGACEVDKNKQRIIDCFTVSSSMILGCMAIWWIGNNYEGTFADNYIALQLFLGALLMCKRFTY